MHRHTLVALWFAVASWGCSGDPARSVPDIGADLVGADHSDGTADLVGPGDLEVEDGLDDLASFDSVETLDLPPDLTDLEEEDLVVDDLPEDLALDLEVAPETQDLQPDLPPVDSDGDGILDPDEIALGTDPHSRDTDTDGIEDGDELEQGTDPTDPSSATAWHPEYSGYPKLSFRQADLSLVRERVLSPVFPHSLFWQKVQSQAAANIPSYPDSFSAVDEFYRSKNVKAAAFAALILEDSALAVKASAAILALNPNFSEVGFSHPEYNHADIFGADAVIQYVQSYDFLAGSGLLTDEELGALRSRILEMTQQLYVNATSGALLVLLATSQNNHGIKVSAALGIAGLCFNDAPLAPTWINMAATDLQHYLTAGLVAGDGAYAEGPYYLIFSLGNAMAFFRALELAVGQTPLFLHNYFITRDQEGEVFEWFDDLTVCGFPSAPAHWLMKIAQPDLKIPNFDDSHCDYPQFESYYAMCPNPAFLWALTRDDYVPDIPASSLQVHEEAAAMLPVGLEGVVPDYPLNMCDPEGGTCVFRTGFGPQDTYVLLMGEHGVVRVQGGLHDHPEANSLALFARGQHLLVDGGYVRWDEKGLVDAPANHSLILVDGEGPPDDSYFTIGSDTFIEGFEQTDDWVTARSSTTYAGADFRRTVVFLPPETLVALDQVSAASSHSFQLLWQGNGGGQTGNSVFVSDHGATYALPGVEMQVAVAGLQTPSVTTVSTLHSFSYGQKILHEALAASQTLSKGYFLTVVRTGERISDIAQPVGDLPTLEVIRPSDGTSAIHVISPVGMDFVVFAAEQSTSVLTAWGNVTLDHPLMVGRLVGMAIVDLWGFGEFL